MPLEKQGNALLALNMFTLWTNLVKQETRDIEWSFSNGFEITTDAGAIVKAIANRNMEIKIITIFPNPTEEQLERAKKGLQVKLESNVIVNGIGLKKETFTDLYLIILDNLAGWENNRQFLGAEIN